MGTLNLPCCTGGTLRSVAMLYVPGMLPILPKESGNVCLRSSMLMTNIWSCNGEMKVAKDVLMTYGM